MMTMTRANSSDEIPLSGGRTNVGVVRIGNNVHRPLRPNSEFVQELLQYIHNQGCDFVPEPLGFDDKGREVLSFIEGDVPEDLGFYDDDVLVAAAKLIRTYHDVSSGFVPAFEVICHNDLSPCNFVFQQGKPVAIIDFDAAAPGSRVMDVGYAAWLWLNLGDEDISVTDQHHCLNLFLSAYGEANVKKVVDAMLLRQTMLIQEGKRLGNVAMLEWAQTCHDWTTKKLLEL
jgi:serine/threonine protein kinase